ncbi:1672_t:CDS:1, partial [Ambispora gerdemannii]
TKDCKRGTFYRWDDWPLCMWRGGSGNEKGGSETWKAFAKCCRSYDKGGACYSNE